MKKLKFSFVSTMEAFPLGGSEELWWRTAYCLAQKGHNVSVSVRFWPSIPSHIMKLSEAGASINYRKLSPHDFLDYVIARTKKSQPKLPIGFNSFKKWLKKERPDLVCFSSGGFSSHPQMMKACYELGFQYVSIGQMNAAFLWPSDDQFENYKFGLTHAKRVFFVSIENLKMVETQICAKLPYAEIVRNPYNVRYEANPSWIEPTKAGCWRIACVARLEIQAKGQDLIFRLLSKKRWKSRPIHLTLYGDGPNKKNLMAMAEMMSLQGRVTFAGHVDDIENVWSQNHALILPSRYEGLPLALVEAMLCNRIGIVTCVSGNPEVVIDNVNGFLAHSPTVDHLDYALEKAWVNRNNWQPMGLNAGEYIRKIIPKDPVHEFTKKLLKISLEK